MTRQTVSARIDPKVWREFKSKVSLEGEKLSHVLESLIQKYLREGS